MRKFIAITAWWVCVGFTSVGFAGLLVKAIVMRTLAANFVALSYALVVLLALFLNRTSISLKWKAADILELPFRLKSAATPFFYWVALTQARFRHKAPHLD